MRPPRSLWWSQIDDASTSREPVRGDLDVDVAIVGGGFTGLWTARELLRRDPLLRVCVLEARVCGFGASGRNGGWVSALFPADASAVIARDGLDAYHAQRHVLQDAVANLGRAAALDGIDCHFVQGGTLSFARSELQERRARHYVTDAAAHGVPDDDLRWMDADEVREMAWIDGARGAAYSPHCARIQPALLVRGLARVVESLGAQVYEGTRVTRLQAGTSTRGPRVLTATGTVRARYVVRATEGFTPTLAGQRRTVAPLYSLMIASQPQSREFWSRHGFDAAPTFNDERHLLIYGQRTADGRLAFGGRGSPYHFGSTVEPRFDLDDEVFVRLGESLRELFPGLEGDIDFAWGGPLAMPRDKFPSVRVDHATGLASAGGYTGDGVTLSYVCAQALADLIVSPSETTEFSSLPFVNRPGRRWEIEPLRWIGINAGIALATWADHSERSTGRDSRASRWLQRLMSA